MTAPPESEKSEASARWTYRYADAGEMVEYATVMGCDVALPPHFHDEDQITFVLSGRRRFVACRPSHTEAHVEIVEAGRGVLIPAGAVHRSLPEPAGVVCLNLYAPAGDYAATAMMEAAARLWREIGRLDHGALASIVEAHRTGWTGATLPRVVSRGSVAERARSSGVSREGFSRAFARRHGMPPHAFDLMGRLNHARRLLRLGEATAAAACEAGFADQSHLGRCFRQAFGVTPGQFRRGRITNVPDATLRDR